jgi:2',3'-cyclic-nucleotide 2'-phosphodiesterase (5'-nucleotidase family)
MRKTIVYTGLLALALTAGSCASHYAVSGLTRTRILVDRRYDVQPDEEAAAFLQPYTQEVNSKMRPVVGSVAGNMSAKKPESTLSNLLSDILLWTGSRYGESPDFAVYNMGGIRAALSKGDVTLGDILDVAPFENKICYLTLSGSEVTELFRQMAARGGEGVSHGVELVITGQGKLISAKLHGQAIDPAKPYRVATLDYLAQGNDGLGAFKHKTQVNSPQEKKDNIRELIAEYFREKTKAGEVVDSRIEGRIKIAE